MTPISDRANSDITLDDLIMVAPRFRAELDAARSKKSPKNGWYLYDSLNNLVHLDQLLKGEYRSITQLAGDATILDIGAADGELAVLLSRMGFVVDVIDHAPTNHNGLEGARILAELFTPQMRIMDINIDRYHIADALKSSQRFGLALFLGILYHLKNPYLAMEQLAGLTKYCIVSTRVARLAPDRTRDISDLPIAYLVDRYELNRDPTNFWIFTRSGLERLFARTGWRVVSSISVGDTRSSDPVSMDHDERVFALLESVG